MKRKWHRSRLIVATGLVAISVMTLLLLRTPIHPADPPRDLFPIRGIDISAHNGIIDFNRVAADSIRFALIKATEGASFKDPRFLENYHGAKNAGLKTGAYHFFRFDVDGTLQGINIVNSIGQLHLDMPVAIDVEEWANPGDISTAVILDRLDNLVAHLRRSGLDVMLYTNKNGHHRFLRSRRNHGIPLWICSFSETPPDMDWLLWQYTHRGQISGISGPVDINVFNGSDNDWQQWLTPGSSHTDRHNKADRISVM